MSKPSSPRRPSSPPVLIHHSSPTLIPKTLPTAALVSSVAGASHYSSVRRVSDGERARASFGRGISEDSLSEGRKRVLHDLKELFCSRPTTEIFERTWRQDAVYEAPLSKCIGFKEYAPQWFALPKVFPKSKALSTCVLSSTDSPNRLVYSQTQEYTLRFFGMKKTVRSLVIVDLDDEDKIIKLDDRWDGEEQPTGWGALAMRRFSAKALPWLVGVGTLKAKSH